MDWDLAGDLGLAFRLIAAAAMAAIIGLEREVHGHPAGMRTHLLVAVGSAGFTVLSITAFPGGDTGRVAADELLALAARNPDKVVRHHFNGLADLGKEETATLGDRAARIRRLIQVLTPLNEAVRALQKENRIVRGEPTKRPKPPAPDTP